MKEFLYILSIICIAIGSVWTAFLGVVHDHMLTSGIGIVMFVGIVIIAWQGAYPE